MKEIQLIASLMKLPGIGPSKVNHLLETIVHNNISLADLANDYNKLRGLLSSNQIAELSRISKEVGDKLQVAKKDKWHFISITSPDYPQSLIKYLKKSAPPILSYKGNVHLLKAKMVGFCGSRKPSIAGLNVAGNCAYQLAQKGIVSVSGYASGVDQHVHKSSLRAGGETIIVLPTGLLDFKIRKNLRDCWDWDRVLIISQFLPDAKWSIANAMTRNKTIVALSELIILIESKDKGGSMDAGLTALKMGKPLYTPIYSGMPTFAVGNRILLKKGALPLTKEESAPPNSFKANLLPLYTQLNLNFSNAEAIDTSIP